ncbi:Phospholipid scramblase 2 [Halotydeus destructor]|nr:Phospholipid scramblase 2 [Halotydeus destructor]
MSGPPPYPPVTGQPQAGFNIGFSQPGYPPAPGYPPGGQPGYPPAGYPPAGYPPPAVQAPAANWMQPQQVAVGVPPGLEYLTAVDQLLVHQKVELLEAFVGFETSNKYTIKNSMGQKVFYAVEDTDCCTRNCCGPVRPFDMKILDHNKREVIHLYRPLRCDSCWCPCCLQRLEVMAPPGNVIGYVAQEWSLCVPKFKIQNAAGETVLRIEGPFCTFSMCGDVKFQVLSKDGSVEVGKISKQWSGLIREAFTDSDHFGISFPMDLDANIKAVLLGALFLIDYMFFEKSGNEERDRPGMF